MDHYYCNYCQEKIVNVRIICAECPDFELCLQCFSCGAESGRHKRNHKYRIIDKGTFPVFGAPITWTAKEELALLDAVEHYGYGNWEDISVRVETRTPEEVEHHYCDMYVRGNIGKATWPKDVSTGPTDHPTDSAVAFSYISPIPPVELTPDEQHLLGYLPFRDDYDREFESDEESKITGLAPNHDDEELETALKVAQADMYSRWLQTRVRMKRVAKDYKLAKLFLASIKRDKQTEKKKKTKEENDLPERVKQFAQFQRSEEHHQIFENLRRGNELKLRIQELSRYRKNGITKLEDCSDFDNGKPKTVKKKKKKVKKGKRKSFDSYLADQSKSAGPPKVVVNGIRKRRKVRRRYSTRKSKPRQKK